MPLLKVVDYRTALRTGAGYVLFKLRQSDGTISNWIGWNYVPPGQLGSLQVLLATNNAYYDTEFRIFTMGAASLAFADNAESIPELNPEGIETPITQKNKKSKSS